MTKRERGEQGTIDLQEKKNKMLWTKKKKNNNNNKKMKCMQGDLDGSRGVKTGVERCKCREGIEEQTKDTRTESQSIDLGVEKLSRIQTQSRSIHQVLRCRRDCDRKKLQEARQIASYRGGVEPAFKSSFSRCEKHRHECNPTCNSTNDPINIKISLNSLSI